MNFLLYMNETLRKRVFFISPTEYNSMIPWLVIIGIVGVLLLIFAYRNDWDFKWLFWGMVIFGFGSLIINGISAS